MTVINVWKSDPSFPSGELLAIISKDSWYRIVDQTMFYLRWVHGLSATSQFSLIYFLLHKILFRSKSTQFVWAHDLCAYYRSLRSHHFNVLGEGNLWKGMKPSRKFILDFFRWPSPVNPHKNTMTDSLPFSDTWKPALRNFSTKGPMRRELAVIMFNEVLWPFFLPE